MKLNSSINLCSCCYGRSMRPPNFLSLERSKLVKGAYQFSTSFARKSYIQWYKPTGSHFTSLGKKKKFAKKQFSQNTTFPSKTIHFLQFCTAINSCVKKCLNQKGFLSNKHLRRIIFERNYIVVRLIIVKVLWPLQHLNVFLKIFLSSSLNLNDAITCSEYAINNIHICLRAFL